MPQTDNEWAAARRITDGEDRRTVLSGVPVSRHGLVNSRALLLRSSDLLKDIQNR